MTERAGFTQGFVERFVISPGMKSEKGAPYARPERDLQTSLPVRVNAIELARRRHARLWMTLSLLGSDLVSLFLSFGLANLLLSLFAGSTSLSAPNPINSIPLLLFFVLAYAASGLYPAIGVSPVDELRLLSKATVIVFALLLTYTLLEDASVPMPRAWLILACPIALLLTQGDRWLLRIWARNRGVWGEPVAIVGTGRQTQHIQTYIKDSIRLGMRPVVMIDGFWSPTQDLATLLKGTGIRSAVLVVSEMSTEMKSWIIDQRQYPFHHLILIPPLEWGYSLGITTHDLEGMLGLGVPQNLLNRWVQWIKRSLDLSIILLGSTVIFPLGLIMALLVRLDSRGPIFYAQERVGVDGKSFKVWKFRTMVNNAEQVLQKYLADNADLKQEWLSAHKLKDDPRVTRIGKILRKLSLDELPQLWNVLIGEMSLVGPRPIPLNELDCYDRGLNLYKQVRPGITGLWQVSGRNECSYADRMRYNEYYIRNWSIWLDIYILLRTVWVVLSQRGAY